MDCISCSLSRDLLDKFNIYKFNKAQTGPINPAWWFIDEDILIGNRPILSGLFNASDVT